MSYLIGVFIGMVLFVLLCRKLNEFQTNKLTLPDTDTGKIEFMMRNALYIPERSTEYNISKFNSVYLPMFEKELE